MTKNKSLSLPRIKSLPTRPVRWLVVGFLFVGLLLVGIIGFEYYTASRLFNQGKALVAAQKYEEAIEKLTLAQSHWAPGYFKSETELTLQKATELRFSQEAYERGLKLFDKGQWLEAAYSLRNVIEEDPNYGKAQVLISDAAKKLTEQVLSEETSEETKEQNGLTQNQQASLKEIERKQGAINDEIKFKLENLRALVGDVVVDNPDEFLKNPWPYIERCSDFCIRIAEKLLREIDELQAQYDELEILRLQILGQR